MKKTISFLLIVICIFSLVACSESGDIDYTKVSDKEWKSWLSGEKIENVDNYTIIMTINGGSWGIGGHLITKAKYDVKNDKMSAVIDEKKYNSNTQEYTTQNNTYNGDLPEEILDSLEHLTETIKSYKESKSTFTYDKKNGYYEMSTMGMSVRLTFSKDGFRFYIDTGIGTTMHLTLKDINQTVLP